MNDQDLQLVLDEVSARVGVVGAQVAVFDGKTQREFATGWRDRERGLSVTADTLFQVGSTTKLLNAALILSLVDAQKLALDVPVRNFLPRFRLADLLAQEQITLRQLLSMSGGIDNGPYHDYGRGDDALGRYIDVLGGIPQIFAPGSAFGYSNASTNVAGYAAATVTAKTWEQLVTDTILIPLGLRQSALFAEDLLLHPVALGYHKVKGAEGLQRSRVWGLTRSLGPAGTLTCCSAGDLVRLARMFLDCGKSADGVRILSDAAITTLHSPQVNLRTKLVADQWCVGPYRKIWGGNILYGHSGTNLSGASTLLWCPQRGIAIAVVVNVPQYGHDFADAIFAAVFPALFGFAPAAADAVQGLTSVNAELGAYIGTFEAFGNMQNVAVRNGKLMLTATVATLGEVATRSCELLPVGDGRFLPSDFGVLGNRTWDIAFWGDDGRGRATHLLNGVFALRRTT